MKYPFITAMVFLVSVQFSFSQNVGIGTINPQNKLHVAGGVRVDTLANNIDSGLVRHDSMGVLYSLKFTGNPNHVLLGNGTFGQVGGTQDLDAVLKEGGILTEPRTFNLGTHYLKLENGDLEVSGNITSSNGQLFAKGLIVSGRATAIAPAANDSSSTLVTSAWVKKQQVGFSHPGGSERYIQFNDNSTFGGDTGLVYNKEENKLTTDTALIKNLRFSGNNAVYNKLIIDAVHPSAGGAALRYSETANFDGITTNPVVDIINGLTTPQHARIGIEGNYQIAPGVSTYWQEVHVPEVQLTDGTLYRPGSWEGAKDSRAGTWSFRANQFNFFRALTDERPLFAFNQNGNFAMIGVGGGAQLTIARDSISSARYQMQVELTHINHLSYGFPHHWDAEQYFDDDNYTPVNINSKASQGGKVIRISSNTNDLATVTSFESILSASALSYIDVENTHGSGDVAANFVSKKNAYIGLYKSTNGKGFYLWNNGSDSSFSIRTLSGTRLLGLTQTGKLSLNTTSYATGGLTKMLTVTNGAIGFENIPQQGSSDLYNSRSSVITEPNYFVAQNAERSSQLNNITSTGSSADSTIRTITINAVLYVTESNFVPNTWTTVGTIASQDFRPVQSVIIPMANYVDGNQYNTAIGTSFISSADYGRALVRVQPNGDIQVFINNLAGLVSVSSVNYVLLPILITYNKSGPKSPG